MTSPEPMASAKEISAWVDELTQQWTAKQLDVKTKEESAIALH